MQSKAYTHILLLAAIFVSLAIGSLATAVLLDVMPFNSKEEQRFELVEKRVMHNKTVVLGLESEAEVNRSILFNSTRVPVVEETRVPEKLLKAIRVKLDNNGYPVTSVEWTAYVEVEGFRIPIPEDELYTSGAGVIVTVDSWGRLLSSFSEETGIRPKSFKVVIAANVTQPVTLHGSSANVTLHPVLVVVKEGSPVYTVREEPGRATVRVEEIVSERVPVEPPRQSKAPYLALSFGGFSAAALSSLALGLTGRKRRIADIVSGKSFETVLLDLPVVALASPESVVEIADTTGRPLLHTKNRVCVVVEAVAYCSALSGGDGVQARPGRKARNSNDGGGGG